MRRARRKTSNTCSATPSRSAYSAREQSSETSWKAAARVFLSFDDLDALEAEGHAYAVEDPSALDEVVATIDEEDLYTFIYTSGTTGPPKGCMIRHRNYYEMVAVVDALPRYADDGDVMLLYLPLAHNFGRLLHLAGPYVGFTTAFLADPLAVADALPTIRPTVLPSVPRV